ncbi:putative methyltransferase DDB_G0268948 isoform X2 [Chenopodium quinoa]|uniref:putative methyltransferase DDB_G0268948 isoform X2 n=1 Tax=Chenopodium quinoa TaxID=63459 RepID=UPI000B78E410|nr:putative methyltransferase DDB_G0268948 isoform X2 [Chenopodium quinoa]
MQSYTQLAELYKNVVGTDISATQLECAPELPNVKYIQTPQILSVNDVEQMIAPESSVDLITVAQAMHWFDLSKFYEVVRWALKKPNGIIAAWCYTTPLVNEEVDAVFWPFYKGFSGPGWEETTKAVDDKYRSIHFPFEPVDGLADTGPFEFKNEKVMSLEDYFAYIRSWSAYNAAKEKGVEMLTDEQVERLKHAWMNDGKNEKVVKFPVYLRMGKVGDSK